MHRIQKWNPIQQPCVERINFTGAPVFPEIHHGNLRGPPNAPPRNKALLRDY